LKMRTPAPVRARPVVRARRVGVASWTVDVAEAAMGLLQSLGERPAPTSGTRRLPAVAVRHDHTVLYRPGGTRGLRPTFVPRNGRCMRPPSHGDDGRPVSARQFLALVRPEHHNVPSARTFSCALSRTASRLTSTATMTPLLWGNVDTGASRQGLDRIWSCRSGLRRRVRIRHGERAVPGRANRRLPAGRGWEHRRRAAIARGVAGRG
jgi:hypothetical protein